MPRLTGQREVARRKQRLRATFDEVSGVELTPELISHYSRYLAVRVCGHAEQSIKELVQEYARKHADERIQRHIGKQLKQFQNVTQERLKQLVESFDPEWWAEMVLNRVDELAAFDSVTAVRNSIAHGEDTGITLLRVDEYFRQVSVVLDDLSNRFDSL
jgi:DNA polymerase III gamma/tau subunit